MLLFISFGFIFIMSSFVVRKYDDIYLIKPCPIKQAHNQEFFGAGEVFGNKGTLKMFHVWHGKEEPRREKF